MKTDMSKISSIGRPIDPDYPTNRAIAIVTVVVMVGGAVVRLLAGDAWIESVLWGIGAGFSPFLAWALCRELDPDHDLSAFVAAGLALVGLFLWGLSYYAALFWLLLTVRVVNRTPGLPATVLDSLVLLGLGGWLSIRGNWGYGAITALAFLLDSQLRSRNRRQVVFAALAVVAAVGGVIAGGGLWPEGAPSALAALIALAISMPFAPLILGARRVRSVGDETEERLEPLRVQAAQAVALLTGVEVAFLGGMMGLVSLMPLWAAVVGAWLYWLYTAVRRSEGPRRGR